jgi:hypothetical protein
MFEALLGHRYDGHRRAVKGSTMVRKADVARLQGRRKMRAAKERRRKSKLCIQAEESLERVKGTCRLKANSLKIKKDIFDQLCVLYSYFVAPGLALGQPFGPPSSREALPMRVQTASVRKLPKGTTPTPRAIGRMGTPR